MAREQTSLRDERDGEQSLFSDEMRLFYPDPQATRFSSVIALACVLNSVTWNVEKNTTCARPRGECLLQMRQKMHP